MNGTPQQPITRTTEIPGTDHEDGPEPYEIWIEDDGSDWLNVYRSDPHKFLGSVNKGINGEWYFVSLNRQAWAEPLQGMDNVKGTGSATPEAAAVAGLSASR